MFRYPQTDYTDEQYELFQKNCADRANKASVERVTRQYQYPRTADEWWKVVNDYWDNLLLICEKYVKLSEWEGLDGELDTKSLFRNVIEAKSNKDSRLAAFFNRVWFQAPDNGNIHGDMAWAILCDLCSESYLLYGEDQE